MIAEVEKLHNQNYIHSDIKACNFCIIENDLSICLIDYNEIIHENHVSFNQNSMGTFTSLGPEFFKKHIIEFVRDAKSLRQFEICIYYALTQIDKSFYPYFFQDRTKTYPFRSQSFFESQKSQALFASLSNIRAKSAEHFTRYELEQHILKYDWKHLFSKESDLYALACVLKFEFKLKEDSLLFPIMQQMLHPEPTHRRIVHTL